jgi:hypothetical protein
MLCVVVYIYIVRRALLVTVYAIYRLQGKVLQTLCPNTLAGLVEVYLVCM